MLRTSDPAVTSAGAARLGRVEQVMGMPVVIEISRGHASPATLAGAFRWLHWVDRTFSTYRPESEISRLRDGTLSRAQASQAVRSVLDACEALRAETDGYFDAWAAGSLDPSGLVKGWAVRGAAALLEQGGAVAYCVNAGGDLIAKAPAPQGGCWRIGIQHPLVPDAVAAVLSIADGAIATSGSYARGDHVVNPRTGRPASGLLSATVVGPDLPTADAYATAAAAMGNAAAEWCLDRGGYEFMLITEDHEVLATPGLDRFRWAHGASDPALAS